MVWTRSMLLVIYFSLSIISVVSWSNRWSILRKPSCISSRKLSICSCCWSKRQSTSMNRWSTWLKRWSTWSKRWSTWSKRCSVWTNRWSIWSKRWFTLTVNSANPVAITLTFFSIPGILETSWIIWPLPSMSRSTFCTTSATVGSNWLSRLSGVMR